MPQHTRERLLRQLRDHSPADPAEGLALAGLVDLLEHHPRPFERASVDPGHVTASALLLDAAGERLAFVWHERLARLLKPGGHCEPHDEHLRGACLRELLEETGVSADALECLSEAPVDVDLHEIPRCGAEGPHQHFDVRYAFRLRAPLELPLVTWLPLSEVLAHPEAGLRRCARKAARYACTPA